MRAYELEDGVVGTCHVCQSSWLDNVASQRVAAGRLSQAFAALKTTSLTDVAKDGYRVAAPRPGTERRCAVCDDPLRQVRVETERVVLDVCPLHGTYFDPNELDTIHRAAVQRNELAEEEAQAFAKKLARTRAEYFAQLGSPDAHWETEDWEPDAWKRLLDQIVRVLFTRW